MQRERGDSKQRMAPENNALRFPVVTATGHETQQP
jgi:hypothetical protein